MLDKINKISYTLLYYNIVLSNDAFRSEGLKASFFIFSEGRE